MIEKKEIENITRTCPAFLEELDGVRLPIGDVSATRPEPGPTLYDMADAAFRAARSSLQRLMPHRYRVVVVFDGAESKFGLDRWVKLRDGSKDNTAEVKGKKKAPVHKRGVAV